MKHFILIILTFFLVSCGSRQGKEEQSQSTLPLVTAVNYPLFYFAQRIGGDLIRVEFPAPAGVDPAYWIPDDEALGIYQSADIILSNGADYAKWMNNVSLPASRIFNTSQYAEKKYIRLEHGSSHSHGPDGEHVHAGFAFTTWLDFELATMQAKAVSDALIRKLPESRIKLQENYEELKRDLLSLHAAMNEVSTLIKGGNIIGSHPVYQYLSRAYDMNIWSVHFEPGEMPTPNQWSELGMLLENHQSRMMLWEDEPMPEINRILKEKEILVSVFKPCGNRQPGGDFISIMEDNIQELKGSLSD